MTLNHINTNLTNADLSEKIFDFLKIIDVDSVVVCAGARNAPFVFHLEKTSFKTWHYFEERSAGFFSLGLIKAKRKPVAIVMTSGTAVAEVLPAAIEAYYQNLPLIIISADRPKHYRGTGAPQSIEQVGLFSCYVENVYDFDFQTTEFVLKWSQKKPLHINVCYDEPLMDNLTESAKLLSVKYEPSIDDRPASLVNLSQVISKPLVIVGELALEDLDQVKKFILNHRVPVYAESLSQLRSDPEMDKFLIKSTDQLVKILFKNKIFESVIRIGGVPTLRFWRDLESDFNHIPVVHFSNNQFSGLARKAQIFNLNQLESVRVDFESELFDQVMGADFDLEQKKQALLAQFPLSEPNFIKLLSEKIQSDILYLGNSLPIRYWDIFAKIKSEQIYANRGANGIDGQISTYLGWSIDKKQTHCLVGDLTAMYDLAAFGLTSQLPERQRNVYIMNNFGGQIFNRIFKNKNFLNSHQIQFKSLAELWGWNYRLLRFEDDFHFSSQSNSLVELQPDASQTEQFWNSWDSLCQKI